MTPSSRRYKTELSLPTRSRAGRFWNPYGSFSKLKRELGLRELMTDPLINRLMTSDGIQLEQIQLLMADMRTKLGY